MQQPSPYGEGCFFCALLIYVMQLERKIEELPHRGSLSKWLPKGKIGCEVGVLNGIHALCLLRNSDPKKLHLIDRWSKYKELQNLEQAATWAIYKDYVTHVFGQNDHVVIHDDDVINVMPTFQNDYFDWVYIDACHNYDSVMRDITLALPKTKIGGYICGHDFLIHPTDWRTGVIRAVIETIQNGYGEMVAITNCTYGDWAVRVVKH